MTQIWSGFTTSSFLSNEMYLQKWRFLHLQRSRIPLISQGNFTVNWSVCHQLIVKCVAGFICELMTRMTLSITEECVNIKAVSKWFFFLLSDSGRKVRRRMLKLHGCPCGKIPQSKVLICAPVWVHYNFVWTNSCFSNRLSLWSLKCGTNSSETAALSACSIQFKQKQLHFDLRA